VVQYFAVGDSISWVRGCRIVGSKMVSVTKLSDFILNRLCLKMVSRSKSLKATSSSGREGDLRLPEPSAMVLFLSNYSGLLVAIVGSESGWDQV
jgi:hypothetical protein